MVKYVPRRTNGFDATNRPQNKPLRDRKPLRKPRTTNLRTAIAWDKNAQKKPGTLGKYRQGYILAFKVPKARERMLRLGFKAPNTYKWNQQGGVMFAMPKDIPVGLTDEEAGWIVRECYESKRPHLTKSNMESVRAMLSFAYQLKTGQHSTQKTKANFPSVKDQFGCQTVYAAAKRSTKAKFSAEPADLKRSWTTEWNAHCQMVYPRWCVAGLINWDWDVNGCRSGKKGGLERIKKSRSHMLIFSQGVMSTEFVGGRPKIPGINKCRSWKCFRICLCPKGIHVPLPPDWEDHLDEDFNPVDPTWTTICPLNMFAVVQGLLRQEERGRTYANWLENQGRFGDRDVGQERLIPLAREWLDCQGGNPDNLLYCSNSGRKSLGKWCAELKIPYSLSHQIHGDLWSTWQKFYQKNLRREPSYSDREQSTNLDEATEALWRFARYIGRGKEAAMDPCQITDAETRLLLVETLRSLGKADVVSRILDGRR